MNDIVLSALANLFALFSSTVKLDLQEAKTLFYSYLSRYFGVRNSATYLELFVDLRELYDFSPSLDKSGIIREVCGGVQRQIKQEEQALLLLRFMEFCSLDKQEKGLESHLDLFKQVALQFNVSDELFHDFFNFVSAQVSDNVVVINDIRVLNLKEYNKIVFSYIGNGELLLNDIPVLHGMFTVLEKSSVLKLKNSQPLYYSTIIREFDKETTKKTEITLCANELNFRFPNSDNGIHDLFFSIKSGELVAIMGGSGVGKSTLLSLLNGSLKPQQGTLLLNGYDVDGEKVKDLIGYVPQDDLLIEELTVFDNLWFTAKLCFDSLPDDKLELKVNKVLSDLGLSEVKHLKVGSAINKYISGGQRKRLNIALELIREPSVLYLDEPTSGLSSSDSEKVINLLREQTYLGRLIVVNIHQPSSDIFKLFDRLWLLDKGGYPIYDGNPIEAVTYFKDAAGYADAEISTCSTCGNVNPEVVLNIIDEKTLSDSGELTDVRKVTPVQWHEKYLDAAKSLFFNAAKGNVPSSQQRRPSFFKQFVIFLQRNLKTKITNTQYLLIALFQAPILAVIVALLTRYAPEEGYSVMDNKNLVSYFFMAVIVAIFLGMSGSAEEIFKDKALLKRERFLRLSNKSYMLSKIVFVALLSLVQTFLFIIVGNSIMGISGLVGVWWLVLFLSSFLAGLTGLILSQSLNSIVAIYITIPLLLIPQILLCGLVVKFDDLAPNSKSGNVPIIGEVIPSRWAFEALCVANFSSNEFQRMFFDEDKGRYEAQYYRHAFLYELEVQLETAEDERKKGEEIKEEHFEVLRSELPRLAQYCEIEMPFSPEEFENLTAANYNKAMYDTITNYIDYSARLIENIGRFYTRAQDRAVREYISEFGKDAFLQLKKDNYNLALEQLMVNFDTKRPYRVVGDRVLHRAAYVYISPDSKNGRAPFFSPEKNLGSWSISTLWFNVFVLVFMSIIVATLLFLDIPSRLAEKQQR